MAATSRSWRRAQASARLSRSWNSDRLARAVFHISPHISLSLEARISAGSGHRSDVLSLLISSRDTELGGKSGGRETHCRPPRLRLCDHHAAGPSAARVEPRGAPTGLVSARERGGWTPGQPERAVARPGAPASPIQALVLAYHAASDEPAKDSLVLLMAATIKESERRPVCRYCFAPLANGAAFCDEDCEDAAWDIVPTINGKVE
jgi:hypothetical protein